MKLGDRMDKVAIKSRGNAITGTVSIHRFELDIISAAMSKVHMGDMSPLIKAIVVHNAVECAWDRMKECQEVEL